MITYRDTRVWGALLAAVLLGGCGGARPCPTVREPGVLAPTETLLVMRGAEGEPMSVVENDSPAGDVFLRTPSLPVRPGDPAVTHLLARMMATLLEEQGVGIAAPQVGINRRAIWVKRVDLEPEQPFRSYLNIELVDSSEEQLEAWEGCLSIPAGFGKVWRAASVTVSFDREDGTRAQETIAGFAARIFQHEIDHLDGMLFIDRRPGDAPPLMPKAEYREMRRKENEAAGAGIAPEGGGDAPDGE